MDRTMQGVAVAAHRSQSANLDFVRSVAVAFVVIFHTGLFFGRARADAVLWPLGHWGVLMFFVHTSLVLMLSLQRQVERAAGAHGAWSLPRSHALAVRKLFGAFMIRRLFRIAPLATVVILAIVLLGLPLGHLQDGQFHAVPLTHAGLLANLLFVQNIVHVESPEAPLWSLPYEMQMYLVLPVLFVLAYRLEGSLALLGAWAAAAILSLAWAHFDRAQSFDLPDYVPCFLAGVLAYRLMSRPRLELPFPALPVVLAATTFWYLERPTLIVGWACCLLLGVTLARCREMARGLASSLGQLIARYSYAVYLSHFFCIWYAFVVLAAYPVPIRIAAFVISLITLPVALYHCIEAPMIACGARLADASDRAGFATAEAG